MKLCYDFLKQGDHTIILPHFYSSHFTVVKMRLNLQKSPFFQEISCYDLLQHVQKVRKAHGVGKTLVLLQQFINEVVLWDRSTTKNLTVNAFDVAISIPCPLQKNNCDCGLFAAVVVLYMIGGHNMTPQTFSQQQISTFKKAMVHEFDVVEGKDVFDLELFKSWFPGMEIIVWNDPDMHGFVRHTIVCFQEYRLFETILEVLLLL